MKWMSRVSQVVLGLLVLSTSQVIAGYNVTTHFADVIMEYVNPGKAYNLRTMRSLPYRILNRSDGPMDLTVDVEIPPENQLKPGYEAIPDPTWIRVVPNKMHLNEGEEGLADIIVQVPEGTDYVGHHYQVHIVCRSVNNPTTLDANAAMTFGVALASRLRFSVGGPGPEQIRRMQKQGLYQMLNFTLEPDSQYVPGFIEVGKKIKLADLGVRISLFNRSPQKLLFSLKSVPTPNGIAPATGYESGDPAWLKVTDPTLKVGGGKIKWTDMELQLPDDPKLRGKRYMLVIQAGLEGREIPVEVFSRVYFNVKK